MCFVFKCYTSTFQRSTKALIAWNKGTKDTELLLFGQDNSFEVPHMAR